MTQAEKKLIKVLQNLVHKIDQIHSSPKYESVWTVAYVHGIRYDGPSYENELAAAKRLLEDLDQGYEKSILEE